MCRRKLVVGAVAFSVLTACANASFVRGTSTSSAALPSLAAPSAVPSPLGGPSAPAGTVAASRSPAGPLPAAATAASAFPSGGQPSAPAPTASEVAPAVNPQSPEPSSPPSVPFATALAAVALDSRTVAALVERCYEEKCTRAVQVRATGGSWHGAVVDRYPWATMAGVSGLVGLDAVHLVVYGESGIFRSTDGGRSWHKSTLIRHVALAAVDGQGLLIVCASCGAARQDTVVAIDSGGAVGATLLTAPGIVQVLAVGGSDYVLTSDVVAGQSLRVSRDHGSTWQFLSPPGYWISGGTLRLASAGGAGLVLVVAAVPTTTTQLKSVYRSVDSGLTWTKVADAEPIGFATSVVEPSPDLLWRYGGQASVRRSSNGGATWTTVLTDHIGNAAGRQVDGFAAEGDSAWVLSRTLAGDGVDAYETHDGGGHWTGTVVPVG